MRIEFHSAAGRELADSPAFYKANFPGSVPTF